MFRARRLGRLLRSPAGRGEDSRLPAESPESRVRRLPPGPSFTGPPARGGEAYRLDGDPEAVRTARALVTDALRAWGRADLLDDAALVVSELVTNALVHGSPPVTIAVTYDSDLVIEVADAAGELPVKRLPGSGGHFGVWLAEELCDLHVRPRPDGKTVRAVFQTP